MVVLLGHGAVSVTVKFNACVMVDHIVAQTVDVSVTVDAGGQADDDGFCTPQPSVFKVMGVHFAWPKFGAT